MKIQFLPYRQDTENFFTAPIPATKAIPNWFKTMPPYLDGGKKPYVSADGNNNGTVKTCSPFLDSLMMGYIINLNVDLQVTKQDGVHYFVWRTGRPLDSHDPRQISKEQASSKLAKEPYKFINEWVVKTPKGYSTLFTHPLNRTDLPFQTLSGVVDTDSYKLPVNFPFMIDNDFEGVIEKGTPIAQLIPIKRESWSNEVGEYSAESTQKADFEFHSKIHKSYKSLFWHKKDYR